MGSTEAEGQKAALDELRGLIADARRSRLRSKFPQPAAPAAPEAQPDETEAHLAELAAMQGQTTE